MTRVRVDPMWLALREPMDAATRAEDLVEEVRQALPRGRLLVAHDLACGAGAMVRWLAPRLPGSQHWVGHDLDADLLDLLDAGARPVAADGARVTVEIRNHDVTTLQADDLRDAALITSSALLDLLSMTELRRFVAACAAPGCAVLLTTSVTGVVEFDPPRPADASLAAAFNAHQRRTVGGRHLLGPDAADAAHRLFSDLGRVVVTRSSPWRLGSAEPELTRAWLAGWLAAAREQEPHLAAVIDDYEQQRECDLVAGRLRVLVAHRDLFVRPVIAS